MHLPAFRRILTNGWMKIKLIGSKVEKKPKTNKNFVSCKGKVLWRLAMHSYAQTIKCFLMIVCLTVHLPENLLAAIWIRFK